MTTSADQPNRDSSATTSRRDSARVTGAIQKQIASPHFRFPVRFGIDGVAKVKPEATDHQPDGADNSVWLHEKVRIDPAHPSGNPGRITGSGKNQADHEASSSLKLSSQKTAGSENQAKSEVERFLGWTEISVSVFQLAGETRLVDSSSSSAAFPDESASRSDKLRNAVSDQKPADEKGTFSGGRNVPFGQALNVLTKVPQTKPGFRSAPSENEKVVNYPTTQVVEPVSPPNWPVWQQRIERLRPDQKGPPVVSGPLESGSEKKLLRARTHGRGINDVLKQMTGEPSTDGSKAKKWEAGEGTNQSIGSLDSANAIHNAEPRGADKVSRSLPREVTPAPTESKDSRTTGDEPIKGRHQAGFDSIPLLAEPAWPYVSDLLLGAGWPFVSRIAEGLDKILEGRSRRLIVGGVQRGVGTTTLAVTLARWAAANHRRVLLVDADIQMAGLSRMLGRNPARVWPTTTRGNDFVKNGLVRSSRTGIACATIGQIRNRQIWPPFVLDRLGELLDNADGIFDLVLVDAGPVTQVVAELSGCLRLSPCLMVVSGGSAEEEPMIRSACHRLGELGAQRIVATRNFSAQPLRRPAA